MLCKLKMRHDDGGLAATGNGVQMMKNETHALEYSSNPSSSKSHP